MLYIHYICFLDDTSSLFWWWLVSLKMSFKKITTPPDESAALPRACVPPAAPAVGLSALLQDYSDQQDDWRNILGSGDPYKHIYK